ncbi:MAG: metal-dependent hydrolase, partial [Methanothrix sp.]|nr:metal-dependent hydrolase [Methanothrix sp.]
MDFITHALLLFLLGRFLGLDRRLLAALVLGGISPDLDFWLSWPGSLLSPDLLLVHRGITHSLLFGMIFGLLVLYLAALPRAKGLWGRFGGFQPDISMASIVTACCGVMIHLLMDFSTGRGVPIHFPWDLARYSAEIFFQIEPAVLAASIIVTAALIKSRTLRSKKSLFVVFLLFLLVIGAVRIDGKLGAMESYPDNSSVHPDDMRGGSISAATAFPRLQATSSPDEAKKAVALADDLPAVGLFRWRAYAVAVNATA